MNYINPHYKKHTQKSAYYLALCIVLLSFIANGCNPATINPNGEKPITPDPPSQTANYTVSFVAQWSARTHPTEFPLGAHFSPLVIAVHNNSVSFWEPGMSASNGIESMAETGGTSILRSEIRSAISTGTALSVVTGRTISSPSTHPLVSISASQDHSLLTIVSMIAPSPDWFVGVRNVQLYNNGWEERLELELFPYDAGTENGSRFSLFNPETSPRGIIQRITGHPFESGGSIAPLGRFIIQRSEENI